MTDEEKRLVQSLRGYATLIRNDKSLDALSADLIIAAEHIEYLSSKVAGTYFLEGLCKAMLTDLDKQKEQIKRLEEVIKNKDMLFGEMEETARVWRNRAMEREID